MTITRTWKELGMSHEEKLARILRNKFEMSFSDSRAWEDLPLNVREDYLAAAGEVIAEMRDASWCDD